MASVDLLFDRRKLCVSKIFTVALMRSLEALGGKVKLQVSDSYLQELNFDPWSLPSHLFFLPFTTKFKTNFDSNKNDDNPF